MNDDETKHFCTSWNLRRKKILAFKLRKVSLPRIWRERLRQIKFFCSIKELIVGITLTLHLSEIIETEEGKLLIFLIIMLRSTERNTFWRSRSHIKTSPLCCYPELFASGAEYQHYNAWFDWCTRHNKNKRHNRLKPAITIVIFYL